VGDPVVASADGVLLGQILQNLVANAAQAAKTLSSPRVRVHAYAHGDRAIVSVRDNGPGIPVEMHDKIFEPFYTTRRGRGGTGLGLALCREYAVQMNAEISLWSLPGRGACFRVSLPRA
jgi:signal transduction histidine kinase